MMVSKFTFFLIFLCSFACSLLYSSVSRAEEASHQLIRRIVVFPFVSVSNERDDALEAWWKIREVLTSGKQFLVASKDFLERKDVFQSRAKMSPADVIILSELLDAQMIVSGSIQDKRFTLYAYEAVRGQLVWSQQINMNPSLPLNEQIEKTSLILAQDLIASFPYHGFVIRDELEGSVVYKKNGKLLCQISFSTDININVGDDVQWLHLNVQSFKPLFMGGANLEIYAEGKIVETSQGRATVEVMRVTDLELVKEESLVRFPRELKRVKEHYALRDSIKRRIHPDYFSPDMSDVKLEEEEKRPLATALSFLINAATILLLAF